MNTTKSINPATEKLIKEYTKNNAKDNIHLLKLSKSIQFEWENTNFEERSKLFMKLSKLLISKKIEISKLMTEEMGKLLKQSISEVEKCADVCEYYAKNAQSFLENKEIKTDFDKSFVTYQPLGLVLAIMPWNFPLWQVFRFAAPTLMAGNTAILKHASNVSGCSELIEQLFIEAGFPKGVFQSTITDSSEIEGLISNNEVAAVTITGSTDAGIKVSRTAGENLKKIVLELGGNDPYIILEDADIDLAVQKCSDSRLLNNGQSCIAAKRFIVQSGVYEDFIKKLKHNFESKKIGDPTDSDSDIGPMAREDLRQELHDIVIKSKELGAKVITGGKIPDRTGFYYPPTILTNVTKNMPAYSEELFGPVACVYQFDKLDDAIEIANDTDFGLGGGVFSKDIDKAVHIATKLIKTGNCAVNDFVKSNPLLPFGGIKKSGYGRELSENGMKEFVNIKTITVRRS